MKAKAKLKAPLHGGLQPLHLEFHDAQARSVALAGTFNDWRPAVTPMIHLCKDLWVKDLLLPPGRYEYRLVVDGQWICDPAAIEKAPNPFGDMNAVLIVPPADSERKPQP